MKDWFYEQSSARLKKGKATKDDVFYLWLHTKTAMDFLSMCDCADDIAMRYGWLELVRNRVVGDDVNTGVDFEGALAGLCFEVVGALAKGKSDLMSRFGMLQGLETIYNVGGWSKGDYIGVAFPLALRCLKAGATALRNFDPSRHGEISRLIDGLDKFNFHKQVKVADSVEWLADCVECEISRLESCAVSDGVKLYRAAAFLNVVYRDIGNTIIDWLKVADIGDNFALSKIRETVTGDESARAKFLSPFTYNKRLDCVEFVGSCLYGDLLDVARFESSRNGAAHAGEIATAATVTQPQQGAAAVGSCAAAGNVGGTADSLLNENAAQFVTEYKPGISFRFRCNDCEGVTIDIHDDLSNANIGRVETLLVKDRYVDGWCKMPDDWKRPSKYKTDAERIIFTHLQSKRDIDTDGFVEGNSHLFRFSPVEVKRRKGGSNKGAAGVGMGRGNKKE